MEKEVREREKKERERNKHSKISSSSRLLKRPKKIMTTSADETPKRKKNLAANIL